MGDGHELNHQVGDIAKLAVMLLHVKGLAEAEVAEDIEDQVSGPVSHVERPRPLAAILIDFPLDKITPAVQVGMDEGLCVAQRLVRESIVHDTALAVVSLLGGGVPSSNSFGRPRVHPVIVPLANIGLEVVDFLEASCSVHRELVRGISESWSWNQPERISDGDSPRKL